MRSFLYIMSCAFIMISCQSSPVRQFSSLKNGMEKSEVLETMGTPWTTTRLHGKDRWIYVFYDDGVRYEREVHFLNGSAVYIGESWKPEPEKSAEIKDQKNVELDKQFKEEAAKAKEENKNAFIKYEQQVKGVEKKVKYMPDYEEIK